MITPIRTITLLSLLFISTLAIAHDTAINTVAVQGYDVVSYHQGEGVPVKGNGGQVAYHRGETYLFSTAENRDRFEANPEQYLPAYGGYCAFGVTGGRKFVGDPLAYRVVDGTLYLNLSLQVQSRWIQDIPGNIERANQRWETIKDVHPSEL